MTRLWIGLATIATALVLTVIPSDAQVRVDIGINLPGPPPLVVIPGLPVYYAPRAPANVFFYANQYWVFTNGGWHVGPTWNGPWVIVAPVRVPVQILGVPVRYYPAPPPHWKGWRADAAPQWEAGHGREWREDAHERDWREREEKHSKHGEGKGEGKGRGGCPPGLAKQGRC